VNPLARIGAASLQKILNILSGMNEDTSTIVRIKFGDYNQMAEKSEMTACAV
jgi:hypothetical protein